MRIALVPPAFIPYKDDSPFSTIFLCQQIGQYLLSTGHDVVIYAIEGSASSLFKIVSFDGLAQPSIFDKAKYKTNSSLEYIMNGLAHELETKHLDAVVNFGHDELPYSIDLDGFLNVVTFSNGINKSIDNALLSAINRNSNSVGFLSMSQAATYNYRPVTGVLSCPVSASPNQMLFRQRQALLFAGRVTRSKGILNALSVSRKANMHLFVAGNCDSPELSQKLQRDVFASYLGCLPRNDLFKAMRSSSAMLQLQDGSEPEAFGIATAEALCSGMPIVTWECGANTEIVKDGADGIIVPFGDVSAAAEAVKEASMWPVVRRNDIRQRAIERFSLESVGKRYSEWIASNVR